MRIGIIGGTGIYELDEYCTEPEQVRTPYGTATVAIGEIGERELVFLARHGEGHSIPPHKVNYRANIHALYVLDCDCIIATNATGSMNDEMQPGDLVLPDQFIDFTKGRPATFHDGGPTAVRHVDVTEPYCPALRQTTAELFEAQGSVLHQGGIYVATEGPRFETPAEIRMFQQLGGDIVGMTGVPEVVLAREARICYMSLCLVTNIAAGLGGEPLSEDEVQHMLDDRAEDLRSYCVQIAAAAPEQRDCNCRG